MGSHNSNPLLSTFLNNRFGWVLYCLGLSAQWHIKSRFFFSIIIQTGYLYIHNSFWNKYLCVSVFCRNHYGAMQMFSALLRSWKRHDGGLKGPKGPMMLVTNTKHSLQGDHVYNISLSRKGYKIIILNTPNRNVKNKSNVLCNKQTLTCHSRQ